MTVRAFSHQVVGVEAIKSVLAEVTPKHADGLMRATIRAIAADIRKDMRANAPVGRRGRLKAAKNSRVKMRRPRNGRRTADIVFHEKEAFFWRFVEHGTGGPIPNEAQPFVEPAKQRAAAGLERRIAEKFSRVLERKIQREMRKQRARR